MSKLSQSPAAFASIWLVAKREIKTRLRAKSTIVSTIILAVLIGAGIQVATFFASSSSDSTSVVGVSEATDPLSPYLQQATANNGTALQVETITEADAATALYDGDIDVYVAGTPGAPVLKFDGTPDPTLIAAVTSSAQNYTLFSAISAAGGDPDAVGAELAKIKADVVDINPVTAERDLDLSKFIVSMVTISLLLFALIQSGSLIAVGVVEEKASRVVEILLATIRPAQLLAGKVLGIGIVTLIQVVIFAGVGAASAAAAGLLSLGTISLSVSMLSLFLWFFLGFALYVSLFGGLASLVSRQEDIGAVTTPMIFGMMIPFYVGIYLIPNAPDALVTKILSQVPFFAPFMMPVRMGIDAVTTWELLLSIALCLVTIPLTIWVGGRVYSRAVLNTGGRMKLSAALKGA